MARKPRIHYPGAIYHVMLRGNGGTDIFLDDEDRTRFYLLLQEGTERFGHRFHAFCLMTNHIHLVLQVGTIPLSRIMQNLSFRHARWINRRRKTVGHVFQGRYKAILVDGDSYLLQLVSYLHLNPVRAGMVETPAAYPWSSHCSYLGHEILPWLTIEPVLSQFSNKANRAGQLFDEFVSSQKDDGHRTEFHGMAGRDSRFLADDTFVDQALRKVGLETPVLPKFAHVYQAVKQTFLVGDEELKEVGQGRRLSEIRALFAWAVLELSDGTLSELGTLVNRDATTLSSAVKRLKKRAAIEPDIVEKMERLHDQVVKLATLQS